MALGGGLSLPANANWEQVPAALPVIIFTLVFHDIAPGRHPHHPTSDPENHPHLLYAREQFSARQNTDESPPIDLSLSVICAYLEGDLARIRLSILVGSLVPLVSLLVWDDIALGLATTDVAAGFDVLGMVKTE